MKPLPHQYDVDLTGGPSGYAELSTTGVPRLQTAPPAEYDGPGDAWSPEHLLLASVQRAFSSRCVRLLACQKSSSSLSSCVPREPSIERTAQRGLRRSYCAQS